MHTVTVKSILNKTKKRDPWFLDDYTLNPYSGCSFNCLFCYIRGSKYGEHTEMKTSMKINAPELLEKELSLRAKKQQYGIIVFSSATEAFSQLDKETKISRQLLEIILKYKFPVHIITRSEFVTRDFDLLHRIAASAIIPADLQHKLKTGTILSFSFSTLNNQVAKIFEPAATPPSVRLETLKHSVAEGFLTGVSMMPLLPYISDTKESLHEMFNAFKNAGSHYILPATLTLFGEGRSDSKQLVFRAIEKHFPQLKEKYSKLFETGSDLPHYYRKAFYEKMKELGEQYQISHTII